MENRVNDWPGFKGEPDIRHAIVEPSVRVFEVCGPADWHALCALGGARDDSPNPFPGRMVPDWSKVAESWDAVHMTLGGVLTSTQVRAGTEEAWSFMWAWDCECTLWLRDRLVFEEVPARSP